MILDNGHMQNVNFKNDIYKTSQRKNKLSVNLENKYKCFIMYRVLLYVTSREFLTLGYVLCSPALPQARELSNVPNTYHFSYTGTIKVNSQGWVIKQLRSFTGLNPLLLDDQKSGSCSIWEWTGSEGVN